MDPSELHWRTNSSFSPLSRRWDLGSQSDELLPEYRIAPVCGSSSLVHSKRSRSRISSDQYSEHHHSTSDGAVSYFESPRTLVPPRWGDHPQRFDVGDIPNPSGYRPDASLYPQSAEKCIAAGISPVSNSMGSGSPPSESGHLGSSSSKHPVLFSSRNVSGRRSFMSKPVYPLSFRNPISDAEVCGLAETSSGVKFTATGNNKRSPQWPESDSSPELKFHKTLTELQKIEASPTFSTSSRREGFRWSNASSYDFGIEADGIDVAEPPSFEYLRSPIPMGNQKCGLCKRLLYQKSPWSSHRIVRNSDMPVAGVLSCKHVFHADCLEEMTPITQIHDPPCPVCSRAIDADGLSFSEPLQAILRPKDKMFGCNTGIDDSRECYNQSPNQTTGDLKRNRSLSMLRRGGSSLLKSHFKKHLSFKGRMGRDLFGTKLFRSSDCASLPSTSTSIHHIGKKQAECSPVGSYQPTDSSSKICL